jgi:hypothetical protein
VLLFDQFNVAEGENEPGTVLLNVTLPVKGPLGVTV